MTRAGTIALFSNAKANLNATAKKNIAAKQITVQKWKPALTMSFKVWLLLLTTMALVVISGCDPAKKMQRICERHPDVCKQDTVNTIVRDTFMVQSFGIDTTFYTPDQAAHDTIY